MFVKKDILQMEHIQAKLAGLTWRAKPGLGVLRLDTVYSTEHSSKTEYRQKLQEATTCNMMQDCNQGSTLLEQVAENVLIRRVYCESFDRF